ncbi:uncharacterized protein LOC117956489 [Etheostoma cragini]|uniref:uncharacterized protein LOC117956489 n=1 Tax=Etheostoma cragini TaxID=417921 RepID=UPI00155F38B7|nr:uncharacterized protein LOC117956489 [Etheostoma cragini]
MSSGFCVRVLVLLLLTFGQHAEALSYRSGGSKEVKPYFGFQSLKPASSENLKPATAPSAGGDRGSYGRQVDGYSPEGSVSSYRPGPPIIQKPRQQTQQPLQTNSNAGVLLTKAEIPKTEDPMSGIASSYGILMYASPQSESTWQPKPPQQSYQKKSQQPSYPFKPQEPASMVRPQQLSSPDYLSKPQGVSSGPKPTDSNPKLNLNPRSSMASPDHPRWQQHLMPVPVPNRSP